MLVLPVLCSTLITLAAHPYSTQNAVDKKISVQLTNVLLREALDIIGAINGESFIYVSSDVLNESKVSLHVRNERTGAILKRLLSPYELSYKVVYNRIVIRQDSRRVGFEPCDISLDPVDAGLPMKHVQNGMPSETANATTTALVQPVPVSEIADEQATAGHPQNPSIWLVEGVVFYAAPSNGIIPSRRRADSVTMKAIQDIIAREFGNILYQPAKYPAEFRNISAGLYCDSCEAITDITAQHNGFVNAFAMQDYEQDFMQMMEVMLIAGKPGVDRIINSVQGIDSAAAKERLRKKEAMVVRYFSEVWSMDFYRLQQRTSMSLHKQLR